MKTGLKIRLLRHNINLDQCQMAGKLNISVGTYSRIETGLDKLPINISKGMKDIFGQSVEEYLEE